MSSNNRFVVAAVLVLTSADLARGQVWTKTNLRADRLISVSSVSLSGSYVAVGGDADLLHFSNGRAAIFEEHNDGWKQNFSLQSDCNELTACPLTVAIDGERAAIGGTTRGIVLIFERLANQWQQTAEILVPDQPHVALDLRDDKLLVGGDFTNNAYLYEFMDNDWTLSRNIEVPNEAGFGLAVALGGDHAAIGTRSNGAGGSVSIVDLAPVGQPHIAEVRGNDIVEGDSFGSSVALDGEFAIVGAKGAAYIFESVGEDWRQVDLLARSGFASTVSLDGNRALVGRRGGAVLFERGPDDNWRATNNLMLDDDSGAANCPSMETEPL